MSLFDKLKRGLQKTTQVLSFGLLGKPSPLSEELLEELEEQLLVADLGPAFVGELMDELQGQKKSGQLKDALDVRQWLRGRLLAAVQVSRPAPQAQGATRPAVWIFLGVNGVGKTTTLGKLGQRLTENKFKVLFAAADTFRAAAGEQLSLWAGRCNAQIVRHQEGGDPSAVIFDACDAARGRDVDFLLIDTAGRLHNKKNLMDECGKMLRTVRQKTGSDPEEVFLVVDATTGQNAVQQARLFGEVAKITGLVLTKMDGTARGGVAVQLVRETGIPIRFIGVGETAADLVDFDARLFVDAILPEKPDAS